MPENIKNNTGCSVTGTNQVENEFSVKKKEFFH